MCAWTELKSDGGKLNRAIPEFRSVPYSKWRESCAAKKLRKFKENIAQLHPWGSLKKPKCRLIENLCDLPTVRDIQMSVTTRRASELNEFFSSVHWRAFALAWSKILFMNHSKQMFLLTVLLDEICRVINGGLIIFTLHFAWRTICDRLISSWMVNESYSVFSINSVARALASKLGPTYR